MSLSGAAQGSAWGSCSFKPCAGLLPDRGATPPPVTVELPLPRGLHACQPWHLPPRYYDDATRSRPMFTIVRDPIERAISEARFRGVPCADQPMSRYISRRLTTFLKGGSHEAIDGCHWLRQVDSAWHPDSAHVHQLPSQFHALALTLTLTLTPPCSPTKVDYVTDSSGRRYGPRNMTLLRHDRLAEGMAKLCPDHIPLVRKRSIVDSLPRLPPRIKKRFGSGGYSDSLKCATKRNVVLDANATMLLRQAYAADFSLVASVR